MHKYWVPQMKTSLLLPCSFIQRVEGWQLTRSTAMCCSLAEAQGDVTSIKLQVCNDGGISLFMKIHRNLLWIIFAVTRGG